MTLYLPEQNAVFLRVPKVASAYITAVLQGLVECRIIAHAHDTLSMVKSYNPDLWSGNPPTIFAFIRHPVSWYTSYFRFRMGGFNDGHTVMPPGSWKPFTENHLLGPIDACGDSDVNEFIMRCIMRHPGFLTDLFNRYCLDAGTEIQFVGRYENLHEDLYAILVRKLGIYDYKYRTVVGSIQPLNVSVSQSVVLSQSTISAIHAAEYGIIKRFWT